MNDALRAVLKLYDESYLRLEANRITLAAELARNLFVRFKL